MAIGLGKLAMKRAKLPDGHKPARYGQDNSDAAIFKGAHICTWILLFALAKPLNPDKSDYR